MAGSENSPENLAEFHPSGAYGWLSPRISFSTDFGLGSPRREEQHHQPQQHQQLMDEWSQEFEFSLAIECPCGSPADEIFYQGKLLPLQLLEQSGPGIHLVKELLLQEASVTGSATGIGTGPSSSDRSCDSSGCTSPFLVPASPSKLPSCATAFKDLFGLRRRNNNRYSLRLFGLFFRRHMLGVPASHPVGLPETPGKEHETPASDDSLANSSTLPPGTGTLTGEVGNSSRWSESVHVITETSTPTPPPTTATTSGVRGEASESTTGATGTGSKQVRGNATMNSGRILWKNLERCSKSCGKGGVRKHAGGSGAGAGGAVATGSGPSPGSGFSSNVRVAPVLNVPMCMGPVKETKSTMAGLRKLFTVKKGSLHRVTWACPGGAI